MAPTLVRLILAQDGVTDPLAALLARYTDAQTKAGVGELSDTGQFEVLALYARCLGRRAGHLLTVFPD
jgi:hypothetical protein